MRSAVNIEKTPDGENYSENQYYPAYKVGWYKKDSYSFKPWKVHFNAF
jgi:hypothetical protein